MPNNDFWGNTPASCIYDLSVLLQLPHDYMAIDPDSEAYVLLHRLYMNTDGYDPFYIDNC